MKKVKLLIYGKVQGVGFRYWTKRQMKKLGIEGEVWNNEDGTVGVGDIRPLKFIKNLKSKGHSPLVIDREKFGKLVEKLKQGPPLARVDKVDILK